MLLMPFPCRPQQTQQLQLPGRLTEAHSSLLDVTASPLLTLDWCCTSSTKRSIRVIIPGLILREEIYDQSSGDGPGWHAQKCLALGSNVGRCRVP